MKKWALVVVGLLICFAPAAVSAQPKPIVWKLQSTHPAVTHQFKTFKAIADRVKEMSGGRLVWELLPAGAVVGTFEVLDAVNRGVLDGAPSWPGYWAGKNTAAVLFAGTLGGPLGMRVEDYYAWLLVGGGNELYNEFLQKDLKMENVIAFLMPLSYPEPFGWLKKPVRSLAELRGLKMRSSGLGVDMLQEMGMTAVVLSGAEILPALERGVVEAVEWSDPATDVTLGFHQVAKYYLAPSSRQPFSAHEVLINKKRWGELPPDLQAIVRSAIVAEGWIGTLDSLIGASRVFRELGPKYGVTVIRTPPDVLEAEIKAGDKVIQEQVRKNPTFARLYDRIKEFAAQVTTYVNETRPPHRQVVDYYFGKK